MKEMLWIIGLYQKKAPVISEEIKKYGAMHIYARREFFLYSEGETPAISMNTAEK